MRNLPHLLAGFLLVSASSVACASELEFGSLRIQWLDGFVDKSPSTAEPPYELAGPVGEKVLVTTMRPRSGASTGASTAEPERIRGHEEFLHRQSAKAGKVAIPVTRDALPDGSVVLYTASAKSNPFASGYFLQYLVLSPAGRIGYFTVEGKGVAEEQNLRFLPAIKTITWLQ